MLKSVKLQKLTIKTALIMKILYQFFICIFLFSINLNAQDLSKTINKHLEN